MNENNLPQQQEEQPRAAQPEKKSNKGAWLAAVACVALGVGILGGVLGSQFARAGQADMRRMQPGIAQENAQSNAAMQQQEATPPMSSEPQTTTPEAGSQAQITAPDRAQQDNAQSNTAGDGVGRHGRDNAQQTDTICNNDGLCGQCANLPQNGNAQNEARGNAQCLNDGLCDLCANTPQGNQRNAQSDAGQRSGRSNRSNGSGLQNGSGAGRGNGLRDGSGNAANCPVQ